MKCNEGLVWKENLLKGVILIFFKSFWISLGFIKSIIIWDEFSK